MFPTQVNFGNLWQDLAKFQDFLAEVHAELANPNDKEIMGEIITQLQKSRAEAEKTIPQLVEQMQKRNDAAKAEVDRLSKELEQLMKETEAEMQVAMKPRVEFAPPPTLEAPIDPALGRKLQLELLERYGGLGKTQRGPGTQGQDMGEAWRDWE